jgi:hypothetical protein
MRSQDEDGTVVLFVVAYCSMCGSAIMAAPG